MRNGLGGGDDIPEASEAIVRRRRRRPHQTLCLSLPRRRCIARAPPVDAGSSKRRRIGYRDVEVSLGIQQWTNVEIGGWCYAGLG